MQFLQEMLRWCKQVSRIFRYRRAIGYFDCVEITFSYCRSEHAQLPPGGGGGGATPLYGLYGDVPLERVWFSSSLPVYNFARVCPTQGIQFRASLS